MKYVFELYVIQHAPSSARAIENLKRLCETYHITDYEVNVIDILKDPHLAALSDVIVVPTLIKQNPLPITRVVGDLSEIDKVFHDLNNVLSLDNI